MFLHRQEARPTRPEDDGIQQPRRPSLTFLHRQVVLPGPSCTVRAGAGSSLLDDEARTLLEHCGRSATGSLARFVHTDSGPHSSTSPQRRSPLAPNCQISAGRLLPRNRIASTQEPQRPAASCAAQAPGPVSFPIHCGPGESFRTLRVRRFHQTGGASLLYSVGMWTPSAVVRGKVDSLSSARCAS